MARNLVKNPGFTEIFSGCGLEPPKGAPKIT